MNLQQGNLNLITRQSRGFGFAYFEEKDACKRFIEATHDQEIDGKRVCCQIAQ